MQIKDIFSKYRFPQNKLKDLTIVFIHRGAPQNKKTISAENIKVGRDHFEYFDRVERTYIPFHRILEIQDKGKTIYKKAKNP